MIDSGTTDLSAPTISAPTRPYLSASRWNWAALTTALIALAGSLWLSIGMNLKACPLCLYQRTFVMGVVAVLGVGLLTGTRHTGLLNLLALPSAVGGFGVVIFHEYLELTGKLECPDGVFGWGTAPQQSLVVLAVLLTLLIVGGVRSLYEGGFGLPAVAGTIVLGATFAVGAILSAPPMPSPPTEPYKQPLEICRPPYRTQ